jgi:superfamily I DNA/RNA helicase
MQVPARLEPHLQAFDRFKTQLGLADYTDLLTTWLDQLRAGTAGIPCSHVLVDEIQDLSVLQGEIIRYLTPKAGTGFFGIGDPDQSIYGFRGAMGDVAECFGRHWPSLETIPLHRNYRSSQTILDFSSQLGSGTVLQSQKAGVPGHLTWYQAQSGIQEAHWMARTIKELIGGTGHQQADRSGTGHLAPGDIAVLVRIKALIPPVHKVLHEQGIPCTVPESTPFWEDERIQPILRSASRFLGLPVDQEKEILDCPDRIVAQGPQKIAEFSARRADTNQLTWSSRPFKDLCTAYASHGDWNSLMAWIHLEAESAHIRQQAQNVRLLTLHGSKGLEFEAVFLPALEQGILPFSGPDLYPGKKQGAGLKPDIEEEKRLFYVGLTRAQSRLYLSCAQRRKIGRFPVRLHPSPLLSGLDWTQVAKVHTVARTRKREKQLSLLDGLE